MYRWLNIDDYCNIRKVISATENAKSVVVRHFNNGLLLSNTFIYLALTFTFLQLVTVVALDGVQNAVGDFMNKKQAIYEVHARNNLELLHFSSKSVLQSNSRNVAPQ